MAKYFGEIGYVRTVETTPGVWSESDVVKRDYYGDTLELSNKWSGADKRNDDLSISNRISILADPLALERFCDIKYATYLGVKWEVTSVLVQYPRLILTLGGVYTDEIEA